MWRKGEERRGKGVKKTMRMERRKKGKSEEEVKEEEDGLKRHLR